MMTETNNNYLRKPDSLYLPNCTVKGHLNGSVSSVSSFQSDLSDEVLSRRSSAQDIELEDHKEITEFKRARSMSDGSANRFSKTPSAETFELFPRLPISVLEKMGLHGNSPRERLTDEELEQKFTGLSLAFTIDSSTIRDRYERQRRYRDQTESNLTCELEKLIEKVHRIRPLCVDFETAELLQALLNQVDIVTKAASLAAISAERYGAVQLEDRLIDAVVLMISHVELLKQQRDLARKHLQYTKRVLQSESANQVLAPSNSITKVPINGDKTIGRRRASIATISQATSPQERLNDKKNFGRRTSDMALRVNTSLPRSSRPNRLELGMELVKIKEGTVENEILVEDSSPSPPPPPDEEDELEDEAFAPKSQDNSEVEEDEEETVVQEDIKLLSNRQRFNHRVKRLGKILVVKYDSWTQTGKWHEVCNFCALLCFSLSILLMLNVVLEYEFAKRQVPNFGYFFGYSSAQETVTG